VIERFVRSADRRGAGPRPGAIRFATGEEARTAFSIHIVIFNDGTRLDFSLDYFRPIHFQS
jgi:hypothetical protein